MGGPLPRALLEHDGAAGDASVDVDEHDAVMRVLNELPPRMREVLVLRYYDDLSEAQIAEALGVSVGTVKSQAARALAELSEAMASTEEKRTA